MDLEDGERRERKELLRSLPVSKIIAMHDLDLVAEICDARDPA